MDFIHHIKTILTEPLRVCIDMGTATTRVGIRGKGTIARIPTAVLRDSTNNTYELLKDPVDTLYGKLPAPWTLIPLLRDGQIIDQAATSAFIRLITSDFVSIYLARWTTLTQQVECTISIDGIATTISHDVLRHAGKEAQIAHIYVHPATQYMRMIAPCILKVDSQTTQVTIGQRSIAPSYGSDALVELVRRFILHKYGIEVTDATVSELVAQEDDMTIVGKSTSSRMPVQIEVKKTDIKTCTTAFYAELTHILSDFVRTLSTQEVNLLAENGLTCIGAETRLPGALDVLARKLSVELHAFPKGDDAIVQVMLNSQFPNT